MGEPHKVITYADLNRLVDEFHKGTTNFDDIVKAIHDSPIWVEKEAAGDPAVFQDGADGVPVESLVVQIKPVQDGEGVPSGDNLRRLSGWETATIIQSGEAEESDIEYQVAWGDIAGTVYGGILNVTDGTLTVTHGLIESYQGEPLEGEWISDRDQYAEGTYPTQGAQVVYQLGAPVVYSLDPVEIKSLLGENSIQANCGAVKVEYCADPSGVYTELLDKIAQSGVPEGGTTGQVFMRNEDGDATWQDLPAFDGVYTITPKIGAETTMHTSQKYLDRNIEVEAIPVYVTGNDSGGNTVIIGG